MFVNPPQIAAMHKVIERRPLIKRGAVTMTFDPLEFRWNDARVALSPIEAAMFAALLRRSRLRWDQANAVLADGGCCIESRDVLIHRIRRKFAEVGRRRPDRDGARLGHPLSHRARQARIVGVLDRRDRGRGDRGRLARFLQIVRHLPTFCDKSLLAAVQHRRRMTFPMHMRTLILLATSAATIAFVAPSYAQQVPSPVPTPVPAPAPAQPVDGQDPVDEGEVGAEITVTGQRERGSVPGDIQPEQVLRAGDIRAYGVSSLTDLLTELGPQLGGGRGQAGGQPVVLLNGRRISGFREIQSYPTEAIERVDILPPEAAQQLGYRAEQRVVNFVLRRRFNAITTEVEGGAATQGDRFSTELEGGLVRIMREKRLNVNLQYDAQTAIYEADRDIIPTLPSRPYAITGNVTPGFGLTQIDPALSALAGSAVTVAGVPTGVVGRPTLGAFLGGVNPSQFSNYRTLQPARQTFRADANYARTILTDIDASLSGSFDWSKSESELGLTPATFNVPAGSPFSPFAGPVALNRYLVEGGARGRTVETNAERLGLALNGDVGKWRWSFTGNYNRNFSSTFTDNSFDLTPIAARLTAGDPTLNPFASFTPGVLGAFQQDYARSLSNSATAETTANGPLVELPAGAVTASLRTGFTYSDFDARTIRSGVTTLSGLRRDTGSGQGRITVPIASRNRGVLSALGNLSVNGAYEYDQVSDFGWLSTYSYGLNWSPIQQLFLLATVSRNQDPPSQNQLGDPVIVTPDARVFDFVRGASVDVTAVSGGNPGLLAPERRVTNLNLNARPFSAFDLNLRAEYTRTQTLNPVRNLFSPTAAIEAAFPSRFVRDAGGQLIRVDNRPVNFQRADQEQMTWGFNFSHRIGPPPAQQNRFGGAFGGAGGPGGAPGGQARRQRQAPTATVGATGPAQSAPPAGGNPTVVVVPGGQAGATPGGGRRFGGPGGPGGGRGGFGGGGFGGGGNDSRVQLAVSHTWLFRDTLTVGPGIPVLDQLGGDATDPIGGARRHRVDVSSGVTKNGYGLRARVLWESGTFVRGGSASNPTDISVAPFTTVQLRSFVQFSPAMKVAREHPWLIGTRVELNVNNLFDARRRVTDATGTVPINYQPDLLDAVGRSVTLSLRKQFFSRPAQRGGALRRAGN